jgi:peptide/nickel transport system ATP-binding protein
MWKHGILQSNLIDRFPGGKTPGNLFVQESRKNMEHILEVKDLEVAFFRDGEPTVSVDNASFHVDAGEIVCLVGESGCGKSVTSLSIMQLLGRKGKVTKGSVRFSGQELLGLSPKQLDTIRGSKLTMVFQDPLSSLNPVFTVGRQIEESIIAHLSPDREAARKRALSLLKKAGIHDAEAVMKKYPHQLSGGMRQRVMIAMALACGPKLVIADEPTTALDVTIQAQIMELILQLRKELGMAVLLITHDMGVVAQMADRVLVMYAGQIIEQADVMELFEHPAHPYTRALLKSVPSITKGRDSRLESIKGMVPQRYDKITGCRFAARCPYRQEGCENPQKELAVGGSKAHLARCCRAGEV